MHMPKSNFTGLRCLICGELYAPGEISYVCPKHGDEGVLDVLYDYQAAKPGFSAEALAQAPADMWRYRDLLPVSPEIPVPPLTVGMTPLYDVPRLAALAGLSRVRLKDDSRQPTASLKDRASALAVAMAKAAGASAVTTASTGNAAAALAGCAASMDMPCIIFVPSSAPKAKIAQLLAYGARVLLVRGTYDQAFELCLVAARRTGWYNRSTAYNPFMTEGKKTCAFEIWEQYGRTAPDAVFVSVGDGCIIGGLHKGFHDLLAMGLIERMPRLFGVQSSGSDYLAQAFEQGEDVLTKAPITVTTIADSIAAGLPRDRVKAMAAVRESGGAFVRVDDDAILAAIPELARTTGVFAEPAAAASWAGLRAAAASGLVAPDERICMVVTGSGLKDVGAAVTACARAGATPIEIDPDPAALAGALRALES